MRINLSKPWLVLVILIFSSPVIVSSEEFREGKHYKLVEPLSETQSDEQKNVDADNSVDGNEEVTSDDETSENEISVVEFFSYGCPVCYDLEPFIDAWLLTKAEGVVFSRVAVPSRKDWVPLARAYYIAEELGITDKVHALIFRAKYENRQSIGQEHLLRRMFSGVADVQPEEFDEAWKSDSIPKMIQNAVLEMRDFGIAATPTLVVDKTYVITPRTAGNLEKMFEIVDYLVDKIETEREVDETATVNESTE